MIADDEKKIRELEEQFPLLSGSAFLSARDRALAAGQTVLQTEGDFIYEVFPDGTRRPVKQIEPAVAAIPGTKVILQ